MKAFIAEGTGAVQQLSGIQNEKIPIYNSKTDIEADIENLEENQIVATKENGFSSDGVYVVSSAAITGGELIANSSMKIMFTSDIVGEDTTTPLSISWNGTSYLVKVAKNSQLQSIYAHEVSSNVFKYIQAYTTLELIFDGVQFVVVGNPLVLSSSDYSIYADGYNDFVNNCELSDYESISITTTNQTAQYDGVVNIVCYGDNNRDTYIYVNDIKILTVNYSSSSSSNLSDGQTLFLNKGDQYRYSGTGPHIGESKARWYKKRDYSNR